MRGSTRKRCRTMSSPKTVIEPELGSSRPSSMESVVVLPAPLPPSSAVVDPAAMVKSIPSTALTGALTGPKLLYSARTSTAFKLWVAP